MLTASANMECVKRFVLGPGDHADDIHVSHDGTIHKVPERTDTVFELLADDVVVHIPENMPYGGDHGGHEGFVAMSDAMNVTWRITGGLDMTFVEFGDDQVVCFVQWLGESLHTGKTVPMRMVEFFRVADGKIAEITIFYWDTMAITEATGGVKTIVPEQFSIPTLSR